MPLRLSDVVHFRDGDPMARLGFGVYQSISPSESTLLALQSGYRHIDTARVYHSEQVVSSAVSSWLNSTGNVNRERVFLTTKVVSKEHGTLKTDRAVEDSLVNARELEWDLYLLHDPCKGPKMRLEAWKVLEKKREEGKLKHIGVSNFSARHLDELKAAGCSVPEVNQFELHPFCQQKPVVERCIQDGIIIQAYCPIVRGQRMNDPVLQAIASETKKTPAQVLIRWSLQKGYGTIKSPLPHPVASTHLSNSCPLLQTVPLPKSDTPSRIKENADVFDFELSEEMMQRLDALDEGAKGACSWNPVEYP